MTPERAARIAQLHADLGRAHADLAVQWTAEAESLRVPVVTPPPPPPSVSARSIITGAGVPANLPMTTRPGGIVTGNQRAVRFTQGVEVYGNASFVDCEMPALTCHPGSNVTATTSNLGWLAQLGSARFTGSRLRVHGNPNADCWRITDGGRAGVVTVIDSLFRTSPTQTTNHADVLQVRGCGAVRIERCVFQLAHPGLTAPTFPWNAAVFVEGDPSIPIGSVHAEDVWLLGGGAWKALALSTAGVQTTWLRLRISDWWRTRGLAVMHQERTDGTPAPARDGWRWVSADDPDVVVGTI